MCVLVILGHCAISKTSREKCQINYKIVYQVVLHRLPNFSVPFKYTKIHCAALSISEISEYIQGMPQFCQEKIESQHTHWPPLKCEDGRHFEKQRGLFITNNWRAWIYRVGLPARTLSVSKISLSLCQSATKELFLNTISGWAQK